MTIRMMAAAGLAIAAFPASAQDISSPYDSAITDHAQIQLESTLSKRRLQQARARNPRNGSTALSPKSRAICLDKKRVGSRFSPAEARRLYSLCARAGY